MPGRVIRCAARGAVAIECRVPIQRAGREAVDVSPVDRTIECEHHGRVKAAGRVPGHIHCASYRKHRAAQAPAILHPKHDAVSRGHLRSRLHNRTRLFDDVVTGCERADVLLGPKDFHLRWFGLEDPRVLPAVNLNAPLASRIADEGDRGARGETAEFHAVPCLRGRTE